MKKIIIAIDGFSGTGKSSTAKAVAQRLGYTYIDTGAMYRTVTLYCLKHNVDFSDLTSIGHALDEISIDFDGDVVLLNGEDVSLQIRNMEVSNMVSKVSAVRQVRKFLVAQQRAIGHDKGIVMDGRDIGTVVFPNAELKVFMTADSVVRAKRRQTELLQKGINEDLNIIQQNLISRDHLDSSREESPLKQAEDALSLDTSNLTFDQQVEKIIEMAKSVIYAD